MKTESFVFGDEVAFVRVPSLRQFWFKVHPACVTELCFYCGSKPGEPCRGKFGFMAQTHGARIWAFNDRRRAQESARRLRRPKTRR